MPTILRIRSPSGTVAMQTWEDIRHAIRIEDRFTRPGGLRDLIIENHARSQGTVPVLAAAWGVTPDRLRKWMRWYGIGEVKAIPRVPPPRSVAPSVQEPIRSRQYPPPQLIPAPPPPKQQPARSAGVATPPAGPAPPKPKPDTLPQIPSGRVVRRLTETEIRQATYPRLTPDQRPAGIELGVAAEDLIAAECDRRECDEPELFRQLYDPVTIRRTARSLGIEVGTFLKLAICYFSGTLPVTQTAPSENEW